MLLKPDSPASASTPIPKPGRVNRSGKISQDLLRRRTISPGAISEATWGSESRPVRSFRWLWMLIIPFLAGGLLLWGIVNTSKSRPASKTSRHSAAASSSALPDSGKQTTEQVQTIEAVVRNYCAATTVEERARYIRDPERVKPLMEAYYPDGKVPPIPARHFQLVPLTSDKQTQLWMVGIDNGPGTQKNLIVESPTSTTATVDWEVDVVWQPLPWDEFATRKDGKSYSFRVVVEKGVLFSHEFSDEKRWQSYKLTVPGSLEVLYGYCQLGSELDQRLSGLILRNNNSPLPAILELKRPESLQSRSGALIEALHSENWVRVAHPRS
ncbi:MAG: hypothetical protein QM627_07415 [Luteolibacter sp.]